MGRVGRRKGQRKREEERNLKEHMERVVEVRARSITDQIESAQKDAAAGGQHGVLVILETGTAEVCDKVPFGKVWQARTEKAAQNLKDAPINPPDSPTT